LRECVEVDGFSYAKDTLIRANLVHWLYRDDTVLHLAAALHRNRVVGHLLRRHGALAAVPSRRRATALHYAADGQPDEPGWSEKAQIATLRLLASHSPITINQPDANGATALHRAVRCRCAGAVGELLRHGADPSCRNANGSTSADLARVTSGRGGSGSDAARAGQVRIIALLADHARRIR
jgi:ankyrin repeat protein